METHLVLKRHETLDTLDEAESSGHVQPFPARRTATVGDEEGATHMLGSYCLQ